MKRLILIFGLLSSGAVIADSQAQKEVQKVILESIQLLEKDQNRQFLEKFIDPKEREKAKIELNSKFIEGFKAKKKSKLLKLFKEAKELKPQYASKDLVSYQLQKTVHLSFNKKKGHWYLSNSKKKPKE